MGKPQLLNLPHIRLSALAAAILSVIALPVRAEPISSDDLWQCNVAANGQWRCYDNNQLPADGLANYTPTKAATGDWLPIELLPAKYQMLQPYYSCGGYVQHLQNEDVDLATADIVLDADRSTIKDNGLVVLGGDVRVTRGRQTMHSDMAAIHRVSGDGIYEGNVRLSDKGAMLVGDKGRMSASSGKASLDNSAYVLYDQGARGTASKVIRESSEHYLLKNGTYTTCPPDDKGWEITASTVDLNLEAGDAVARHAVLRIQDVPVLYSPYLSFAVDDQRKTGFLYPSVGFGSDNGLELGVPFYWNIAPNMDATFTPKLYSARGVIMENEFRFLTGSTYGEIGLAAMLGRDQQAKENPYYREERWLVNYKQRSQLTDRWTFHVDYARASDKNYLEDFGTDLSLNSEGLLTQSAGTQYLGGSANHSWQFSVDATRFQNMSQTTDDPYNKLPQIIFSGTHLFTDNLAFNYMADYTRFYRGDDWEFLYEKPVNIERDAFEGVYGPGWGIAAANGERYYLEAGVEMPVERTYGFLKPAVKVQYVDYRLSNMARSEVVADLQAHYNTGFTDADFTTSPSVAVPTASLDGALYFDRRASLFGAQFTQTLEPRLRYVYSPYVSGQESQPIFDTSLVSFGYHSLWRDSRFTGYDRLGDMNQLSVGINSSWIEDNGFERLRFGFGQTIYFDDRKLWINPLAGQENSAPSLEDNWGVDLNDESRRLEEDMKTRVSPLVSDLVVNLSHDTSLTQDIAFDVQNGKLDTYGINFQYQPMERAVINLGYRYLSQADRYVQNSLNEVVPAPGGGYLTTSNNLSRTDMSLAWPVVDNWSVLGRWQYDLTNHRNMDLMGGVEYGSCCYQMRLVVRHWIDDDGNMDFPDYKTGVLFQFVLRGLGGFATSGREEFLGGIKGYPGD